MVINASQHDDANAVFALQLVERLARLAADFVLAIGERLKACLDGAIVLLARQAQQWRPCPIHLLGTYLSVLQIQNRIKVRDSVLCK